MHNKLKSFLLIFFLFVFSVKNNFAQKKFTYGVGVDIFQTKLNNVDRENFSGYGHSMPGFIQNDQLGLGATFLVQTSIYKNLSFETGLGITNFNSQFHFDYTHLITRRQIKETLNISLYYINLPFIVGYYFPISPSSKIGTSLGLDTRFLFTYQDNYQDILYETIGGQKGVHRYNKFIFSPKFNISYNLKLKNQQNISLEAKVGYDSNKIINNKTFGGSWGFYKNLSRASYQYYGISLKYFFTK